MTHNVRESIVPSIQDKIAIKLDKPLWIRVFASSIFFIFFLKTVIFEPFAFMNYRAGYPWLQPGEECASLLSLGNFPCEPSLLKQWNTYFWFGVLRYAVVLKNE